MVTFVPSRIAISGCVCGNSGIKCSQPAASLELRAEVSAINKTWKILGTNESQTMGKSWGDH